MKAGVWTFVVLLAAGGVWLSSRVTGAARGDGPRVSADSIQAHTFFLASDDMRGRSAGSAEYDRAAGYVEERLVAYGLEPLFADHFEQRFSIEQTTIQTSSLVELVVPDSVTRLDVPGDVAILQAPPWVESLVEFELVFAGLGIHEPELGWNDYAGIEWTDRCAVILADTPADLAADLPAPLLRQYQDFNTGPARKARAAVAHGARCAIGVLSPSGPDSMFTGLQNPASLTQIRLVGDDTPELDDAFAAALMPHVSGPLLRPHLDGMQAGVRSGPAPLGRSIRFRVETSGRQVTATSNVGGVVWGSDPERKEVVVLTAHLDGQGMRGNAVLNSANDNAVSVAALLEAARLMAARAPARTFAYVFFGAEEMGLLGSRYFVDHPPVPFEQIGLSVNMEMIGKPRNLFGAHTYRVSGRLSEDLEPLVRQVEGATRDVRFNYALRSDSDGGRLFRNSDHVNFFLRGVPTIYFYGGSEDYHRRTDDPARINYPKAAALAGVLGTLAGVLDSLDHLPTP